MGFYKISLLLFISFNILFSKNFLVKDVKSFNKVLKEIEPGDKVILKNGVWENINFIFKGKGTYEKPIILTAQTPGKVIITGKSSMRILGNYLIVKNLIFKDGNPSRSPIVSIGNRKILSSFCQFSNNIIDNFNTKDKSKKINWLKIFGYHNRVDHCKFININNKGVTLKVVILKRQKTNYHIIDYNFFGYRTKGQSNGYEIIRIGNSKVSLQASKTIVANNYFYRCDGEIEIISNKSCDNYFIHNTFENCNGMLTLRHGNDCLVKNNFFINTDNSFMGGIKVIGENHKILSNYFYRVGVNPLRAAISIINSKKNTAIYDYLPTKNISIVGNKFINCKYTIFSGANYKNGLYDIVPSNILIENNIFYNNNYIFKFLGEKPKLQFKKNIFFMNNLIGNGWYIDPNFRKKGGIYYSNIEYLFQEEGKYPITKKNVGPKWLK